MKTKIYSMIVLAAASLASCNDNWDPKGDEIEGAKGQLAISDIDVVNSEVVISRAAVDVSNFIVTISDAEGAKVGEWKYGQMPELISLPVGADYVVNVVSHIEEKAAWDAPLFKGKSAKFAINENTVTNIDPITCKLSNIKVSVKFSTNLRAVLSDDCSVTVVANDEGRLEYLPSETRAGYFQAIEGSTTLVATFRGTVNGSYVEIVKPYSDVEAGQHRIISYGVKTPSGDVPDETGTIDPVSGITIDMSVIDESVEGSAPVEEDIIPVKPGDRPGQEDPEPGDDPDPDPQDPPTPPATELFTFTSDTIDFDAINPVDDSGDTEYKVVIGSTNPMAHLYVDIISEQLNAEMLEGVGLAASFDLAYPGALEGPLKNDFGFPVGNEVIGAHEVTFDITQFVPLLAIYPGEIHKFKIRVVDDQNNEKTVILSFQP